MDFEDDKSCLIGMGAGRSDQSFESNKELDLCPKCTHEAIEIVKKGFLRQGFTYKAKEKVRKNE